MRPFRRDTFTISDDLVLGIPEDGSLFIVLSVH